MPLYTFKCEKCEHTFEVVLKMNDNKKPLSEPCPECEEVGSIFRVYSTGGWVDPGILKADKNMEKSGVLQELNRIKHHHPYMVWKG